MKALRIVLAIVAVPAATGALLVRETLYMRNGGAYRTRRPAK